MHRTLAAKAATFMKTEQVLHRLLKGSVAGIRHGIIVLPIARYSIFPVLDLIRLDPEFSVPTVFPTDAYIFAAGWKWRFVGPGPGCVRPHLSQKVEVVGVFSPVEYSHAVKVLSATLPDVPVKILR